MALMQSPWVRWLLLPGLLLTVLSVLTLWSWGRFARSAQGEPGHALPVSAAATALDRAVLPQLQAHGPDASGAMLLGDPLDAFVSRTQTARMAERSLDVQYYIWRQDLSGHLLVHELAEAAQRGVRVRLLLDDMNAARGDEVLLALNALPNVEVRLFNPGRNRAAGLRRALEMGLRFVGFNRRMHNKAWIADNRVAIVGGRNIGDEYFGAADTNFRDTDLLLLGPAVEQTSAIFDAFWNSPAVVPLRALHPNKRRWTPQQFQARRQQWLEQAQQTPWLQVMLEHAPLLDRLSQGELVMHWSDSIRVLSDPPEKAAPLASHRDRAGWLLYDVLGLLFSARHESWTVSPYFVPGDSGTLLLSGQARRGVQVRVLTNSLAANDVPLVHAGYARYRAGLLEHGVELHELRPGQRGHRLELTGSGGASLHSKFFVIDGVRGFVGSFNFDPRSVQLNTEMGVVFEHAGLAAELRRYFEQSVRPEHAWQVTLADDGLLRWRDTQGRWLSREPETRAGLRLLVWLLGFLPIESQL